MRKTDISRRSFAGAVAAGAMASGAPDGERPNVLWITTEDIGPALGCYGDNYAVTPNIDRFAARSLLYRNAWSNAPVCAPARTTIISGLYPPSTGSEHMRSMTRLPEAFRMYPCYLRDAGYYTSNNSKEDYNVEHTGKVWDDSSTKGHWRNRKAGQPFFSVFNFTETHESRIARRPAGQMRDPAGVRVPAYHPDTPEVRRDWAQYAANITEVDRMTGGLLKQLEADGLAADTIVFFYGDHGSGMPRSKRYPYNSGLHVPMIVHVPERFRHLAPKDYRAGGRSDRMVGFVDLAPTALSIAGVKPPRYMQGEAFLGQHIAPERGFNHGFRGRMDERYDLMRTARDKRYVYVRNYMPHRIPGQHVGTMFETPTTQVWKKLYDEGKLNAAQKSFWEPRPAEELYDLRSDPDEVNNLAAKPEHRQALERLRKAQQSHARAIRDVGLLPEGEIHSRSGGGAPYDMGHDDKRYPFDRVTAAAEMASSLAPGVVEALRKSLGDSDSAVRYWAASGLLMRGAGAVRAARAELGRALGDSSPYVASVAAEALAWHGDEAEVGRSLDVLLKLAPADANGCFVSLWVLDIIDRLGARAEPILARVREVPVEDPKAPRRVREYPARIQRKLKGLGRR